MANKNGLPELKLDAAAKERFDLLDLQARHHNELDLRGILAKGLEAATITDTSRSKMNALTRACVHLETGTDADGDRKETIKLKFITPELRSDSTYFQSPAYAEVAYNYPDLNSLDRANDFTLKEAQAVMRLVDQMRLAKEAGVLPNLSSTLSDIIGVIPAPDPIPTSSQ